MQKVIQKEKCKELVVLALIDRWKSVTCSNNKEEVVTVIEKWQVDELITLFDTLIETYNEFTIGYIHNEWFVKYMFYSVRDNDLKYALFRILQECLSENKVKEEYLKDIDKKYLDFFSEEYGF